jgi:hypothetical protein
LCRAGGAGCSIGRRTAREVALARSWRCIHDGGMEAPEHVVDAETRAQILDAVLRQVSERYVDPYVAAKVEAAVRARIDAGAARAPSRSVSRAPGRADTSRKSG